MNQAPTDTGQRVATPHKVSGDGATRPEPDEKQMKDSMTRSADGSDAELKRHENGDRKITEAVRPDRRENDAGA